MARRNSPARRFTIGRHGSPWSADEAREEARQLVGRVPGHKQSRTTQIYAQVHDDPLRAVADRTANVIATAMAGEAKPAEVVPLSRR